MGMHLGAIYIGAHIAGFEYIDIWRSAVIAFLSYIVMAIVGLLLSPLMLVPFLNMFVGAIVLGLQWLRINSQSQRAVKPC